MGEIIGAILTVLLINLVAEALFYWLAAKAIANSESYVHCFVTMLMLLGVAILSGVLILGLVLLQKVVALNETIIGISSIVILISCIVMSFRVTMRRFDIGLFRCIVLNVSATAIGYVLNSMFFSPIYAAKLQPALQRLIESMPH